jgi:GNAT superfamily N-acetyltransferase
MMHELVKVEQSAQWRRLHDIRREVLFDTGIFPFNYDENHPDDRADGNVPYLLLSAGSPIGVVRLDQRGAIGVVRLVGILAGHQRQGHGRALGQLVDARAIASGITQLRVNAFVDATGFYEKSGWRHEVWDAEELARANGRGVQMVKALGARTP